MDSHIEKINTLYCYNTNAGGITFTTKEETAQKWQEEGHTVYEAEGITFTEMEPLISAELTAAIASLRKEFESRENKLLEEVRKLTPAPKQRKKRNQSPSGAGTTEYNQWMQDAWEALELIFAHQEGSFNSLDLYKIVPPPAGTLPAPGLFRTLKFKKMFKKTGERETAIYPNGTIGYTYHYAPISAGRIGALI